MSATEVLPAHLGIILDGNRRWAKENGVSSLEGHRQGAEVFKDIALASFDRGINYLSAYVFSNENWSRAEDEVGYLMKLVVKATEKYLDTFHEAGIKVVVLGRRTNLDKSVINAIERTEEKTRNNTKGTLALCFNYGGREEVADAVKQIISDGTEADQVTPDTIEKALYASEIPQLDLIIRTSGEQRTSGFMLYRAGYAELYFTEKYWPAFTVEDLDNALKDYEKRNRRFGK
jgi:undecaprenyl diphosphate synthase